MRLAPNELGYTTLSVAEPRRGVSVGATSCDARSVTEDNVPLGRARAQVPSGACQPQLCDVEHLNLVVNSSLAILPIQVLLLTHQQLLT